MVEHRIEHLILAGLFNRPQFAARVIPYLKAEYFSQPLDAILFRKIAKFVQKYTTTPSPEAIGVALEKDDKLNDDTYAESVTLLTKIAGIKDSSDEGWLTDETENFCRDRAIELAILEGFKIVKGEDEKKRPRAAVPQLLQNALAVSFQPQLGLDLKDDYRKLFLMLRQKYGERIPFGLKKLDEYTDGGMPKGTLTSLLAQSNLGKSLAMVSIAAHAVMMGKKVAYISMEMADYVVMQRMVANLGRVLMNDLAKMEEEEFVFRVEKVIADAPGVFKTKQFPTSGATARDIGVLLDEWKIKAGFVPDLVCVDYVNIMRSSHVQSDSSYINVKNICEELRGLAVERDIAILTATQTNRSGFDAAQLSYSDVAESKALIDTVDLLIAMTAPKEIRRENLILFEILKNRLGDSTQGGQFAIQVNRGMQRLSDPLVEPRIVQERDLMGGETKPAKKRRQLGS